MVGDGQGARHSGPCLHDIHGKRENVIMIGIGMGSCHGGETLDLTLNTAWASGDL